MSAEPVDTPDAGGPRWPEGLQRLLDELGGLDDLARRRRVHEVIREAAGWTAENQQMLREAVTDAKFIGARDFTSALKEAREQRKKEAQRRREAATAAGDPDESPYVAEDGCLYLNDPQDGKALLAKFVPRVTADVLRDDGAERTRLIRIEVALPSGRTGTVDVLPERLVKGREWAVQAVGAAAVIVPRRYAVEHVVTAAQTLGEDTRTTEVIYSHTGWRRLDDRWRFLTSSGALGADGLDDAYRVDLTEWVPPGQASGFALPDPGNAPAGELQGAVRSALDLLHVAPARMTAPMLGAAFRAPLPVAPESTVFVVGGSGSLKSAFSAVVQQFYGSGFDEKHLPGNWASSANSTEVYAFALANVLMVIDDYAPQASEDPRKLAGTVDRVVRGSANGAGRGRLRPDGTPRPTKHPRAQLMTSGEDVPPGHSLRARMTITEAERGDVDLGRLTAAQKLGTDGTLALAMAGYVRWLAALYGHGDLATEVRQAITDTRARLGAGGVGHLRTPEATAGLLAGWAYYLRYAVEIEAITEEDAENITANVGKAMTEVADGQVEHTREASPVDLWLAGLKAALAGGNCHLADSSSGDGPPQVGNHSHWGWQNFDQGEHGSLRPNGTRIGWVGRDGAVWLDAAVAYEVARLHAGKGGNQLGVSKPTLAKRLAEKGWIYRDGKHLTVLREVADRRTRVTWLRPGLLDGDAAESDG